MEILTITKDNFDTEVLHSVKVIFCNGKDLHYKR